MMVLNTKIPSFRVTTFNLNSLSQYARPDDLDGTQRKKSIRSCLTSLLRNCDLIFLQETHLGKYASNVLEHDYPDFSFRYSNHSQGRAGVITGARNSTITNHYNLKLHKYPPAQDGFLLTLNLEPINTDTHWPVTATNVYFQQGQLKISQMEALMDFVPPPGTYHFLGGDLNLVTRVEDAPSALSTIYLKPGSPLRKTWEQVLTHLNLFEVPQPTHTRYGIREDLQEMTTSRIDSIFISHSPADLSVISPIAFAPYLKNSILNKIKAHSPSGPWPKPFFSSDHIPVSLNFELNAPPPARRSRPTTLPRHLAEVNSIRDQVELNLDYTLKRPRCDPLRSLKLWKRSVRRAATLYYKKKKLRQTKYEGKAQFLNAAIKLLRLVSQTHPSGDEVEKFMQMHPQFASSFPQFHDLSLQDPGDHLRLSRLIELSQAKLFDPKDRGPQALPPSTLPQAKNKNQTIFDEMSGAMRSVSNRVSSLRSNSTRTPTSDPKDMAKIIHNFWSKIWKRRDSEPSLEEVMSHIKPCHTEPLVDPNLQIPTPDDLTDLINGSGNSSAGPDGIPFSFLRMNSMELGGTLHRTLGWLGEGNLPPKDLNFGDLHLLKKNLSTLIKDTRPITVGNSFNRVLAKAVVEVITPSLKERLLPEQKGFIPSRQGSDHILDITSLYYSRLGKKEQIFILFLDTAKAFDSIDHQFIHAVLSSAGFPSWICNVVKGLLHEVEVFPVLGSDIGPIKIQRGVKQGCPLSPILFALCLDVLLHKLRRIPGIKTFAFADDLAVETPRFENIVKALQTISEFSRLSGLGLNIDKTKILTSKPIRDGLKRCLLREGFEGIEFVSSFTYLGVLMGRNITTIDIFTPALDKFHTRLKSITHILKPKSINKRIIIFNVYLLTIFYYLAQFYIIPYKQIVMKVRDACRKHIIPFGGGAFAYHHIITPTQSFGPSSPLRDLWANNITLLASKFDLLSSHHAPTPVMNSYSHVPKHNWGSLIAMEHRAWAAFCFLEDHNKRTQVGAIKVLQTEHFETKQVKRRALIYKELVISGYPERDAQDDRKKHRPSLPNRLLKSFGIPKDPQKTPREVIARRTAPFSRKLRSDIWNTYFRFIFHALPTDYKRHKARLQVSHRSSPSSHHKFPCYLCGRGRDNTRHLFSRCRVVRTTLDQINLLTNQNIQLSLPSLLMLDAPSDLPMVGLIKVILVWAVWSQRSHFFIHLDRPLKQSNASHRLLAFFMANLPDLHAKKTIALNKKTAELALSPPTDDCIVGFSDGSALGNPGPTGGGLWVSAPPNPPHRPTLLEIDIEIAYSSFANNNDGEMIAIRAFLLALEVMKGAFPPDGFPKSMLFSDSLLCICYLTAGWPAPCDEALARSTRHLYHRFPRKSRPLLYWIRGHSDIPLNERVDVSAKKGANAASTHPGHTPSIVVRPTHGSCHETITILESVDFEDSLFKMD